MAMPNHLTKESNGNKYNIHPPNNSSKYSLEMCSSPANPIAATNTNPTSSSDGGYQIPKNKNKSKKINTKASTHMSVCPLQNSKEPSN